MEYLKKLYDKILIEDFVFIEDAKIFQVVETKYKKIYYRDNIVKIGDNNSYKRYVYTRQDCLIHNSR